MFSSGKIHLNLRCLPCTRGPYLVLSKNPKYFLVQIGSKSDSVSVDQLKPVFSYQLVTSQQPPRHGRPSSAPAPLSPAPFYSSYIDSDSIDSGSLDSGSVDSGSIDSSSVDSGFVDSGSVDSNLFNTSPESPGDKEEK